MNRPTHESTDACDLRFFLAVARAGSVSAAARDPRAEVALRAGLAEYNTRRFRPGDRPTLDIVIYDDQSGEPFCGLLGHTSFGLFFLDLFYLPEALHGRGLGSRCSAGRSKSPPENPPSS
jgi:hypothetical protein